MFITNALLVILVVVATRGIVPPERYDQPYSSFFTWITATAIFLALSMMLHMLSDKLVEYLHNKTLYTGENSLLTEFQERLRFCYSDDDFNEAIGSVLEEKGDCSVLYINRSNNYVLYNSPDRLTCSKEVMDTLELNYPESWKDGISFMGDTYGMVTDSSTARGFFLTYQKHHLYIFCRYTKLFDPSLYQGLYDEFVRFFNRANTITNLSEISELSSEWQQLADTQKSFLPQVMPNVKQLKMAAYYRPLVNVSGDYYSVLPIDENKTLLMLGDVSGKGLAAALVMGLVMNTVKILQDKEDLPKMIQAVDKAIKGMKLQDKYTVLFLGVVDTQKMTIRYINASMSDPLIITRSADGYRIKPLTSNCSLVGIIELPDLEVAEQRLFRGDVILMASDGVSEVMDESGEELGNTKLYEDTIKNAAAKSPKEFVDDVVNLIMSYNGNKKLRDDVTMLVAKVEG